MGFEFVPCAQGRQKHCVVQDAEASAALSMELLGGLARPVTRPGRGTRSLDSGLQPRLGSGAKGPLERTENGRPGSWEPHFREWHSLSPSEHLPPRVSLAVGVLGTAPAQRPGMTLGGRAQCPAHFCTQTWLALACSGGELGAHPPVTNRWPLWSAEDGREGVSVPSSSALTQRPPEAPGGDAGWTGREGAGAGSPDSSPEGEAQGRREVMAPQAPDAGMRHRAPPARLLARSRGLQDTLGRVGGQGP